VATVNTKQNIGKNLHLVLSKSYLMYFFAVILGLIFYLIFNISFQGEIYLYTGFILMTLGTSLIYWAQHTSRCTKKEMLKGNQERDFERGPYKYSRSPTHFGLFLLTFGFGLLIGSLFIVIFTFIALMITKLFFLKKEEHLLEERYGKAYCDYKEKVSNWL